jgi:hypothetical protein
MKKILIPALMAILGLVGGAGAGWFLKPAPESHVDPCMDEHGVVLEGEACAAMQQAKKDAELAKAYEGKEKSEFVPLERQFIVPVVSQDKVSSMMVITLGIEVTPGKVETILAAEPKLRDALLRTLFAHAYTGGFEGDFTAEHVMRELRKNMLVAVREVVGPDARNVLVQDIVKQNQ